MSIAEFDGGARDPDRPDASRLPYAATPTLWTGPLDFQPHDEWSWTTLACELLAAPVRAEDKRPRDAGAEQRRVATQLVRALRPWNNSGSLELRYLFGDGRHLRVVLIARAAAPSEEGSWNAAAGLLQAARSHFPAGYEFGPLVGPLWGSPAAWTEIERAEETREPGPAVPRDVASFYYYAHPLGGTGEAWHRLPELLAGQAAPGHLSIVLAPTELTALERGQIDGICSAGQHFGSAWQDYDYFGNAFQQQPDAAAAELVEVWGRFSGRHGVTARLQVGAASADQADRLAAQIGGMIAEDSDLGAGISANQFKIVNGLPSFMAAFADESGTVERRAQHPVWHMPPDEFPVTLARMPYYYGEEEAGGLFILPVPDEQGVPGIARSRSSGRRRAHVRTGGQSGDAIRLGFGLDQGRAASEIVLPLSALNRHTLVVGSSGSGKTTTVLTLLTRLWREQQVPFLAIEPIKTEYRGLLAVPGMEALQVICLGREDLAPLRLNPLEPPPGVRCETHANAVLGALKLALPLEAPLPQLLSLAIDDVYLQAGWDHDTFIEDGLTPPTLRDLLVSFDRIFAQQGYRGEAQNVGVAFRVRLSSLLSGSRGRVLDTVRSSDFAVLLGQPTVIELDEIADPEDKLLLSSFVLQQLRAIARRRGQSGSKLRHLTVIEEAHRLLAAVDAGRGGVDGGHGLRAEAVRSFSEAIAELRSSGEGFVLSSQRPTELAPTAVANTAVRVLHRMEDATDRTSVLDDLDASGLDRDVTARLRTGEALVRWPGQDEPELVTVDPADGVSSALAVTDPMIAEHMQAYRESVRQLLPYRLCTSVVCPGGCNPAVRSRGARVAVATAAEARDIWLRYDGATEAVTEVATTLLKRTAGDLQQAFCGAAQLEAEGAALVVPNADVRVELIPALRRVAPDA